MLFFIYTLACPHTGQVRYVGKSSNPQTRLNSHIHKARTHQLKHHCSEWIRSLLKSGARPILTVVSEGLSAWEWQQAEKEFIAYYRKNGCDLTNSTGGGEGFYQPNLEIIKRRNETRRETLASPEKRKQLSDSAKAAWRDVEISKKRCEGVKSAWQDPEKRERMLAGMRTPEALARRGEATRIRYRKKVDEVSP